MEADLNKQEMEGEELDEQEQDEEEIRQKGDWHQQLLKACQKGEYDQAKKCLDKKANPLVEDKKKWNPLIWSSCKGHVNIVRLLLTRGAAQPYLEADKTQDPTRKIVKGLINNQIKQTPLQWACFKGHLQIVWLLLKAGLSWEDFDPFGNNCVHLAASGGSLAVFQTLLMFGVSVSSQNARGHTVRDLATNKDILALIRQLEHQEKNDPLKKYWCMTCKEFFAVEDYRMEWMFEHNKSSEKEKPEGRCHVCWKTIQTHTDELNETIERQDHKQLTDKLNIIEAQHIEIDLKTIEYARVQQEKLRTQNVIIAQAHSLKYVENYKTIMKSVNTLKDLLEDANVRGIKVDQSVIDLANAEINRLISERNLRFELDNLDVGQCIPEQVQTLQDRMSDAQEKGVANEYIEQCTVLKDKMSRSIQAKKIVKLFQEYPFREYPEPFKIDPKTKKFIDPFTNKIITDPAKLAAIQLQLQPKKKKKKEPKFVTPEWANDLKVLEENVKGIEALIKDQKSLELDSEFISRAQENIKRMKQEIYFRKQQEEEARLAAEARLAGKKKK